MRFLVVVDIRLLFFLNAILVISELIRAGIFIVLCFYTQKNIDITRVNVSDALNLFSSHKGRIVSP